MDDMFNNEGYIEPVKPTKFCRTCAHRQPWECGQRTIQYCGVRKSNRTYNGLLKIKVTTPACVAYIESVKSIGEKLKHQGTMTLYNYIQMRIKGKRTLSIVQDLIDDMKSDKELEGMNAQEIVEHIRIRACEGAWEAMKRFIQQYKQYCKRNNIEHEPVTCQE